MPHGIESANPIMKFFNFIELDAQKASEVTNIRMRFMVMAETLDRMLPNSAEKSAGLRKLLEAKDCFVRAALP